MKSYTHRLDFQCLEVKEVSIRHADRCRASSRLINTYTVHTTGAQLTSAMFWYIQTPVDSIRFVQSGNMLLLENAVTLHSAVNPRFSQAWLAWKV